MFSIPWPIDRLLARFEARSAPAELIEICDAILEEISSRCHAIPGGKVFPFVAVTIRIQASTPDRRAVVEHTLAAGSGLPASVRRAVERMGCKLPAGFQVRVLSADQPLSGKNWSVEYGPVGNGKEKPLTSYLVVTRGSAEKPEYPLGPGRHTIGRGAQVQFANGARKNAIAFQSSDNVSASVSRDHAHIDCDDLGRCAITQDTTANHIEITRRGLPQPVSSMGRPVPLEDGDEIYLGQAILRFELR